MNGWSDMYEYTEDNVDSYAPSSAGVYRLLYKKDNKYYIFYIGQSDDLQRRLQEHLNPSESDKCIKKHLKEYNCYFEFLEVEKQSDRDKIEQEEINKWQPCCNN